MSRIAMINDQIEVIVRRVNELEEQRDEIQGQLDDFEVSEHITTLDYDDFIDECNDIVEVGNAVFRPSDVLKQCDQIAYDLGYQDYIAGLDFSDVPAYTDLTDELADVEAELDGLEDARYELETELEELEENE